MKCAPAKAMGTPIAEEGRTWPINDSKAGVHGRGARSTTAVAVASLWPQHTDQRERST